MLFDITSKAHTNLELHTSKARSISKWPALAVWAGAIAGVVLAILVGVVFICLYYVAQQTAFQGDGKSIFEGVLVLVASFMLTFLAFAMLKIRGYEEKWQAKLEASAAQMVCLLSLQMLQSEGVDCVIVRSSLAGRTGMIVVHQSPLKTYIMPAPVLWADLDHVIRIHVLHVRARTFAGACSSDWGLCAAFKRFRWIEAVMRGSACYCRKEAGRRGGGRCSSWPSPLLCARALSL